MERDDTIQMGLQKYFQTEQMENFQCHQCESTEALGFKNIKDLPEILCLDFKFTNKQHQFIDKNFEIEETLDFEEHMFPNLLNPGQRVETVFELFAAVAFDCDQLREGTYHTLIKKRFKDEKVMKWYLFNEKECK